MIFWKRLHAPDKVRSLRDEELCREVADGNHIAFLIVFGGRALAQPAKERRHQPSGQLSLRNCLASRPHYKKFDLIGSQLSTITLLSD